MQPIIGITTSISEDESLLQMNRSYVRAISAADALPVLLPATEDASVIASYAQMCHGLLLSGGDDIDPSVYGEAQSWQCGSISPLRDAFELALCREFLRLKKPILAICRGIQVLNVALGGTLYQDLQTERASSIAHRQKQKAWYASHPVSFAEGSLLSGILQADAIAVNSLHHQAVRETGAGLVASAISPDGVIEAVELPGHPFCLGVQWHPERLWDQSATAAHARIFRAFTEACQ